MAHKDRKGSPHGDVLIATKDTINGTEIDMDTDTEFAAASFECPGKHTLIIGALYRPQNGEAQQAYAEEICSNIRSVY